MPKKYSSNFENRQEMNTADYEIFYYEDKNLMPVKEHQHDYYEIYFFLEGDVRYKIGKNIYALSYGDICLIPPRVAHHPVFVCADDGSEAVITKPYRRIVLWLSPDYFNRLKAICEDIAYGFDFADKISRHHFSTDNAMTQSIFDKLLVVIEEKAAKGQFKDGMIACDIVSLLLTINRAIYQKANPSVSRGEESLFRQVCDYINSHLQDELTLDDIANVFFMSKYHISHVFKDNMGISIHQYILKKRLQACKDRIVAGEAITEIALSYGFSDYSSFYRSFKKEYGMGPKEVKTDNGLVF